ncbi:hypothetical protein HM1_1974 [Heliomicrobium modesticaldum Ice1]|uniref:Uncharacterized protein n=1 Tax=Heliobacterium modesticaldum (strain ATCC 51547 / Ice1) TaxID=498761 RepID=B0TFV2_HELMI|nr:hypothetical protein HM1_1974 [Heliomicrobium modesticaldum Ice1]
MFPSIPAFSVQKKYKLLTFFVAKKIRPQVTGDGKTFL